MGDDLTAIHPDLHEAWKKFPRLVFNRWTLRIFQWLPRLMPKPKPPAGILVDQIDIQSQDETHTIGLRVYKPKALSAPVPVLAWIHGGGFIIGTPAQDELYMFELVKELGIVIVSIDYRLAPQHPFPAPLDDCYAALQWIHENSDSLGIDPSRIAIGGASAGGGLAANLAQLALDRGEIQPAFQLLVYPMLDDRTVLVTDIPHQDLMTWTQKSNRFGWESYLQHPAGADNALPYSVASRREDLTGLPPAWVGVGTLDLFHDEGVAYAQKLKDCGVDCEVEIVPGAYHGFDALNDDAQVIHDFRKSQMMALKKHLRC